MTVDDGEMQQLWKLTNELTAQLVFNRTATLELKQQLAELQAQTSCLSPAHSSRQNDLRDGPESSSDYALRIANERLREENLQLQEQVNEYERWMGYIMTKFRLQNLAMAQTRKESMQEASKMTEQGNETAYRLQEENSVLQSRLADLGSVARKAIHEDYYTTESLIESLETENRSLREMLGVAEGGIGPVSGRLDFFVGNHGLQDDDEYDEGLRNSRGSRVSFPSTSGSVVASSESDRELPPQPQQLGQLHPLTRRTGSDSGIVVGVGRQPLSPTAAMRSSNSNSLTRGSGPGPLTVQTGLRSPTATPTATTTPSPLSSPIASAPSRSVSSLSSATSPTSPSWSSSTSASSSALASPIFQQDPSRRLVSISPPLDSADDVLPTGAQDGAGGGNMRQQDVLGTPPTAASPLAAAVAGQQKNQRGKMTINTKLGGHSAGRSL
ncbi:hypothetical protein EC957_003991 [Mortierella hygrophila]|uniref:Uncharacterized protein n=1 Tax=Mortierella hygrophila TaxID=979708 RepID=A0A9P6F300_9FUNG|nr:hypothetical protein EC957_003991 [Mortierella hygrophila]